MTSPFSLFGCGEKSRTSSQPSTIREIQGSSSHPGGLAPLPLDIEPPEIQTTCYSHSPAV